MSNKYALGVDGGGTSTTIALATANGEVVEKVKAGPTSLRNTGVESACQNLLKGVEQFLNKEILSTFVGFPAFAEEYQKEQDRIQRILSKEIPGQITVGSDQLVALRSGTDKDTGIVLIAGTGAVAHGFRDGKSEKRASGWGYLGDEGSAFWVGIQVYREVMKQLDGRGSSTLMTELIKGRWNIQNGNELNEVIYSAPMKQLPALAVIADKAEKRGDELAEEILVQAGKELAETVNTVADEMKLKKECPLIIVGGMLKSAVLEDVLRDKIDQHQENIIIKKPQDEPVIGAVKLAIENI